MPEQVHLTVCGITDVRRVLHSSPYVHGRRVTPETPEYLAEVAAPCGIRVRHKWIRHPAGAHSLFQKWEGELGIIPPFAHCSGAYGWALAHSVCKRRRRSWEVSMDGALVAR